MNRTDAESRRRWSRAIGLLLAAIVILLPIPAGSNRPGALTLLVYGTGMLGLAGAVLQLLVPSTRTRLDALQAGLLLLWVLWLAWIAVQWLPLPATLLEQWSPAARHAYAHAADWLGTPLEAALSVARADTLQLGLLSLAYFVLFMTALRIGDRRARLFVVYGMILSATLQAAFGLAMVTSGLEIGPFGPKDLYRGSATGTFVNRNHFAGFLEIGAAMCLGLMIARLRADHGSSGGRLRLLLRNLLDGLLTRSWLLRPILLLLLIALIVSRSRMGNVSFALAACAVIPLYLLAVPGPGRLRVLLLVALIALIDIGIVGSQLGLDELLERFRGTALVGEMRLGTFSDLTQLVGEWGWAGAGLGSFAYIYPAVRSPEVYAFNDHAHNDYAQFLIEAGLPGFVLLSAIGLLVAIRGVQVLRRRADPASTGIALGCLIAFTSLALHSLTDFNLQIPANAATLVILMGLLCGIRPDPPRRRRTTDGDGVPAPAASGQ